MVPSFSVHSPRRKDPRSHLVVSHSGSALKASDCPFSNPKQQYLIIFNEQDGTLRAVNGPCVWFPENPFETIRDGIRDAISLKSNEYVRILDNANGNVRVERGEKLVTLTPTETLISGTGKKGGVETAVNIDSQTAVIARNTKNGQVDLITYKGLFFPGPYEVIESVQKKVRASSAGHFGPSS